MPIVLNHTIVPASDSVTSAAFFADLLGLPAPHTSGPFAAVRVNADLTLDFDNQRDVQPGHYAFLVDDDTFDAVLGRVHGDPTATFGSGPEHGWDRRINRLGGGRGVYVRDPDGHSYEVFTAVP